MFNKKSSERKREREQVKVKGKSNSDADDDMIPSEMIMVNFYKGIVVYSITDCWTHTIQKLFFSEKGHTFADFSGSFYHYRLPPTTLAYGSALSACSAFTGSGPLEQKKKIILFIKHIFYMSAAG